MFQGPPLGLHQFLRDDALINYSFTANINIVIRTLKVENESTKQGMNFISHFMTVTYMTLLCHIHSPRNTLDLLSFTNNKSWDPKFSLISISKWPERLHAVPEDF